MNIHFFLKILQKIFGPKRDGASGQFKILQNSSVMNYTGYLLKSRYLWWAILAAQMERSHEDGF
jgi:hypothetical protein